jgi:DNA-binding IclR family transcriptional regulator
MRPNREKRGQFKHVPKTTMNTVDKALSLLRYFSPQVPELGLSELARLSDVDKTTTLRCMTALERNGFVEQDEVTRKYRIGLAPMGLAQIREHSFPVQSVVAPYLERMAQTLGETTHGTLVIGDDPVTTAIYEPDRALFVHIQPTLVLPWHATASGIAIAAFLPEPRQSALMKRLDFQSFTQNTQTGKAAFIDAMQACRTEGLARALSTYEDEVIGTAAPIFGPSGNPIGSIAVAAVTQRMTPDLQSRIDAELKDAAHHITHELGGAAPSIAAQ